MVLFAGKMLIYMAKDAAAFSEAVAIDAHLATRMTVVHAEGMFLLTLRAVMVEVLVFH